jgi:hypothetical protein
MKIQVDVASSATRRTGLQPLQETDSSKHLTPAPGDVVIARVEGLGFHRVIELADGVEHPISPGETAAVVLGRRYATCEFDGDIPRALVEGDELHLLNVGGVAGHVKMVTSTLTNPTTLRYLGRAVDGAGRGLSTFTGALASRQESRLDVMLVIGSGMDSGKTTLASRAIGLLFGAGFRVGGAKLTGTSRMKDIYQMQRAGAAAVCDFLDAGYPSTYGATTGELERIFTALMTYLEDQGTDMMVLEVADGVLQPETEAVLSSPVIMSRIKMIIGAASDSMAAYGMYTYLKDTHGVTPDFISGVILSQPLCVRELKRRIITPLLEDRPQSKRRFIRMAKERFPSCSNS